MFWEGFNFVLYCVSALFGFIMGINLGGMSIGVLVGGMVVCAFAYWLLKLLITKA